MLYGSRNYPRHKHSKRYKLDSISERDIRALVSYMQNISLAHKTWATALTLSFILVRLHLEAASQLEATIIGMNKQERFRREQ